MGATAFHSSVAKPLALTRPPYAAVLSQARQSAALALRHWVESDTWVPKLMPRLFASGSAAPADIIALTGQVPPPHLELNSAWMEP